MRLVICATCAGGAGPGLARAVKDAVPGIAVETADCLNVCDRPVALALTGAGRDSYLFAGVGADDVADLRALMRLYRAADPGIADARAAGRLRFCLLGRIPADRGPSGRS